MSASVTASRAALAAALAAASIRCSDSPGDTAAPVVHIFSNGSTLQRVGGAQVVWGWRLVLQPVQGTPAIASANLGSMAEAVCAVIMALQGFRLVSVSPDTMRQLAGSDFLSNDIEVENHVDI